MTGPFVTGPPEDGRPSEPAADPLEMDQDIISTVSSLKHHPKVKTIQKQPESQRWFTFSIEKDV